MQDQITTVGMHGWFARKDGAISNEETVPAANAEAWRRFPALEDGIDVTPNEESFEVYDASPTILVLKELITTKRKLEITISSRLFGPLPIELLFGTQALSNQSTYGNPYRAAAAGCRGWLKLQGYDSDTNMAFLAVMWCRLQITGQTKFGPSETFKPDFTATVLLNPKNIINI